MALHAGVIHIISNVFIQVIVIGTGIGIGIGIYNAD
jgi:hypothetical protein